MLTWGSGDRIWGFRKLVKTRGVVLMSQIAGTALGLSNTTIAIGSFGMRHSVVKVIVFDVMVVTVVVNTGVSSVVGVNLVAVVMVMVGMIMTSQVMLTAVVAVVVVDGSCIVMIAILIPSFWLRTVSDCAEIAVLLLPLAIMAMASCGRGCQGLLAFFDQLGEILWRIVLSMGLG